MDWLALFSFLCLFISGFLINGYAQVAENKGWFISRFFKTPAAVYAGIAIMIGAVVLSLLYLDWWHALIVVIGGALSTMILVQTFGKASQPLSLILALTSLVIFLAAVV